MKTIILLALSTIAVAQSPEAVKIASEKFPALRKQGSPLHTEFMRLKQAADNAKDPVMKDPNWPVILAEKAFASLSQTTQPAKSLSGFLEIPWGSSSEEIIRVMALRDGVEREQAITTGVEVFKGGKFAGMPVDLWIFGIGSTDKLHTAKVLIKPKPSELLAKFESIRDLMAEKYGKPELDVQRYAYPYDTDSRGHELTAIKLGKATIYALWKFPAEGGTSNSVSIDVTEDQSIVVTYQNGAMIKSVVAEKKDKNKKDL